MDPKGSSFSRALFKAALDVVDRSDVGGVLAGQPNYVPCAVLRREPEVRLIGQFGQLGVTGPLSHAEFWEQSSHISRLLWDAVGRRHAGCAQGDPLNILHTFIPFTLTDALNFVVRQENFKELCKAIRNVQDNIMELSS